MRKNWTNDMAFLKVEILSLDEIKELGMTLNAQFRLTMAWYDPRIVFYNLKASSDVNCGKCLIWFSLFFAYFFQADDSMNALTQEEKKKIWIPSIVFNNTDDENESILDHKARLIVMRKVN